MTLYAAYGSNLNPARLLARCPAARRIGAGLLPGWRLSVTRFANILPDAEGLVPVGLWALTPADLLALDRAEGFHAAGHPGNSYDRRDVTLHDGTACLTYVECRVRPGPPPAGYLDHLRTGYSAFGLDLSVLETVLSRREM